MTLSPLPQSAPAACDAEHGCITCGDTALPMRVVDVDAAGALALCAGATGAEEEVATDLVGAVVPGDVLLVHARVALARLQAEAST